MNKKQYFGTFIATKDACNTMLCCFKFYENMKDIISRAYRRLPPSEAKSFGTTLCLKMSSNPLFALLKPMIEDLSVANGGLEVAIANAKEGGKASTIAKRESCGVVIEKIDELAIEVNRIAKEDEKIVLASGFEVKSTAARSVDDLDMPTNLKAEDVPSKKGQAKVTFKKDADAVNTALEYQVQGETVWQGGVFSTSSSAILTGLPSGKYVSVRVYSVGRKGLKSDTSEAVTVLVS